MAQNDERFKVLNTKVNDYSYTRAHLIARKRNLSSVYEMLQMMVDTCIRYMDDRHNLTEEMERAMSIFEHMDGWRDALNLADPTAEKEVGEAIYFLIDPSGKKHGTRAVLVSRPFFGNWTQDCNIQHILERVVCLMTPERYRRLRMLAVDMHCTSLLDLIDHLITQHTKENDLAEIRKGFEDCNRSEWGKIPKEDGPYKRKQSKQLDMFAEEEEKKKRSEQARQCLEDNMDFRPLYEEW